MNKIIKHWSLDQMLAFERKKMLDSMSPEQRMDLRNRLLEKMEESDPGGGGAHKKAEKYQSENKEYK